MFETLLENGLRYPPWGIKELAPPPCVLIVSLVTNAHRPIKRRRRPSSDLGRVLFIDDDVALRSSFVRVVGGHGFLIDVAANASEAMALAKTLQYPVVVTDLHLPDLDGIGLIREMHHVCPDTTYLIVTGLPDISLPDEAPFRGNVTSVIEKPWEVGELVHTLHRSLRLWKSRTSRPPPPAESREVLLIEDNEADAELIKAYLSEIPETRVVHEGRLSAALTRLEEESFRVIISDLALPDARGLDSILRLQNLAGDTPLIVLSGLADDELAVQAVQLGAQDYLVKSSSDAGLLRRSIHQAEERKRSERNLARLAHFDPLTGLVNRARFREELGRTIARAQRKEERFAVLYIDLDGFKPINDQHGHTAGDALLAEVSQRFRAAVRNYDTVARLGGDEFAAILDNIAEPEEATLVADRMLRLVSQSFDYQGVSLEVTASIGIAVYPDAADTGQGLLKIADEQMYRAKRNGKNRCWGAHMQRASFVELEGEHQEGDHSEDLGERHSAALGAPAKGIHQALERKEFDVTYEPQIHSKNAAVAARALLSWRRAGRTLCQDEFHELVEQSGHAIRIGQWMMRVACLQLRAWLDQGVQIERVGVTLFREQIEDPELDQAVQRALELSHISPPQLEVELPEEIALIDPPQTLRIVQRLKNLGVRIALTEFGQTQAPLALLSELPLDAVALDASITRQFVSNASNAAMVRAILTIARDLQIETYADGIESYTMREVLHQEGCAWFRGPAFGAPRAGEATANFFLQLIRSEPSDSPARTHQTETRTVPAERQDWQNAATEDIKELSYVIAHDLHAPLRAIAGFTQILSSRSASALDAKSQQCVSYIIQGANNMQRMLDAMVEYSRIETRGSPLIRVDAHETARRAVQDLAELIEAKSARIHLDKLPVVLADPNQLRICFVHLLRNAMTYNDGLPEVWLGAKSDGPTATLHVRDNGIGFEPQYGKDLFRLFQRHHAEEQYSGRGVGLAFVKRIARRHGGEVWADSLPGKGSSFFLRLPLA